MDSTDVLAPFTHSQMPACSTITEAKLADTRPQSALRREHGPHCRQPGASLLRHVPLGPDGYPAGPRGSVGR
jgi:hypothetical protein